MNIPLGDLMNSPDPDDLSRNILPFIHLSEVKKEVEVNWLPDVLQIKRGNVALGLEIDIRVIEPFVEFAKFAAESGMTPENWKHVYKELTEGPK